MPAIFQYGFDKIDNYDIVLSKQVYEKLLEITKLCKSDDENKEYATILYGYLAENNKIFFEKPSSNEDYIPKSCTFDINTAPKMLNELVQTIVTNPKYNCVAHIHTHPYLESQKEGSRFFSQEDIDYYKRSFNFSNLEINKNMYSFGGLISIGRKLYQEQDDISFVHYNPKTNETYLFPNISVLLNGIEKPLNKEISSYKINNSIINYERTVLDSRILTIDRDRSS